MKQLSYILAFSIGLSSCFSRTTDEKPAIIPSDTIQSTSTNKNHTDIFVKDKSLYDKTFIEGLSDYNEPIKLLDTYIITGNDTIYFPDDLPLNKETAFKGSRGNKSYLLNVKRTNLTNLVYTFVLTENDITIDKKSGKAVLGSLFFLASEMDEDTKTGDGYGSSEYRDNSNNCAFSIRIGIGKDDNGRQRAVLTYSCEDKTKQTLDLEECPTLRTE